MSVDFQEYLNPRNFWDRITMLEARVRKVALNPRRDVFVSVPPHTHLAAEVTGVATQAVLVFWASGLGTSGGVVPWEGTWNSSPPFPNSGSVVGLGVQAGTGPGTGNAEAYYLTVNGARTGDKVVLEGTSTSAYASATSTFSVGDVLGIERDDDGVNPWNSAADVRLLVTIR